MARINQTVLSVFGIVGLTHTEAKICKISLEYDSEGRFVVQIAAANSEQRIEGSRYNVRIHRTTTNKKWYFRIMADGSTEHPIDNVMSKWGYNKTPCEEDMIPKVKQIIQELTPEDEHVADVASKFIREEREPDQVQYDRLCQWIRQEGKGNVVQRKRRKVIQE